VKFAVGRLDQSNILPATVARIQQKVKPNGVVVFASCESGNTPKRVQEFANKLQRTVSASADTCAALRDYYMDFGLGGFSFDGYVTKHPTGK
jgi:hypothetical protein